MVILTQPASFSLSGNLEKFQIRADETISFILMKGTEEILSASYTPGSDQAIVIDLREIVESHLSFRFIDQQTSYVQESLVADFTAIIDGTEYPFRVLRGGVDRLGTTAENFCRANFLTWQPQIKPVTYYTPEFLGYYCLEDATVYVKAYFTAEDGNVTSEVKAIATLFHGYAYTIPVQYAVICSAFDSRFPSFYDVWVQDSAANRLTYVQRYVADNILSEQEEWILFENSLGGIDTFRAYGQSDFKGKHTHNVAEIDDISLEYRVDTERTFQKSTGFLNNYQRRWLLDFFPSKVKYVYVDNYIRSIVVTDDNTTYTDKELPTEYKFTYRYADSRPYLNLSRSETLPSNLDIVLPELGSFTIPPRLVEFPTQPLSEGVLFPVQNPFSEKWSTVTVGAIVNYILGAVSSGYDGHGGFGHAHANYELLNLLSYVEGYLLVDGKKIKAGYADEVTENSQIFRKFLRKDQPDTAAGLITFLKGLYSKDDVIIGTNGYAEGMTGFGTKFGRDGSGEMSRLTVRHELRVPSLVFNQTEILVGDKWRAPGAGVIERVMPDYDRNGNILDTGTFWIKLEKGQIGAVFTNAICMGIFHDWQNNDNNATEDSDDSRGNRTYAGFTTSYFTITEISDYTDEEGVTFQRKQCRYQIRPVSERWSGQAHPYEQMNFVCYGVFSDDAELLKKYGTSVYETRTYRRMLWNQNTWEISAANIAYQDGDLSNLTIHGMNMVGYSAYLNSVYFTGTLKQVKPDGTPVQTANDRGEWVSGEKYDFYDRVSHNGGLWLCINEIGTNTEPKDGDPSWLCQVKAGTSVTAQGRWESKNTPYPANSIVTFADKVWISNKETSEPPFGTYMDKDSNRLVYKDGSYVLVETLIQSKDWDLLLDAPQLTDGKDGESLQVRYSSDKSNWHSAYTSGDLWMQQRIGDDSIWSDPIRIVGEAGAAGKDGIYTDYQFAVNDSLTVAPATGWQDTPPAVAIGQYLWMRMRVVDPNSTDEQPWHTARIGGEKGRGVETVTEYYAVSASNSEAPTEWVKDNMPSLTPTLKYLWNYEEISYTDTEITRTSPIVIGMYSKDGNGIKSVTEYYGLSSDSTSYPGSWSSSMMTPSSTQRFLWNKTITEYTEGSTNTVIRLLAVHGEKGDSISNMGVWRTGMAVPYLGVMTMGDSSFLAKVATTNPPLWCWADKDGNRLIFKDDGYLLTGESNTAEYELLVKNGKDGTDGKEHEYVYIHTTDNTSPAKPSSVQTDDYIPSGWHDDPIGVSESLPYEWVCVRTKRVGIWSEYSTPALWAKFGKDGIDGLQGLQGPKGDQGIPGETGAAGKDGANGKDGTDGLTSYFHIKYADDDSGTNMNESGGDYIGTYVDFEPADSNDPKKYICRRFYPKVHFPNARKYP